MAELANSELKNPAPATGKPSPNFSSVWSSVLGGEADRAFTTPGQEQAIPCSSFCCHFGMTLDDLLLWVYKAYAIA